jgi:hypothetical protein
MTGIVLDPDDEFESALMSLVEHHREKALEYGGEDAYQNILDIADMESLTPLQACDVLLAKHQAFLKGWKTRGTATASYVDDAYLDRAVFSVISLVLYRREYDADSDSEAQL